MPWFACAFVDSNCQISGQVSYILNFPPESGIALFNCLYTNIVWKRQFILRLTDPVTAVLYITSDYQHMQELKHTIHVKEVVDGNFFIWFISKFFPS